MSFNCRLKPLKPLRIIIVAAVAAASTFTLVACRATAGGVPPVERVAGEHFSVTATIRFIEIEGGFFGIFADDGRRFDPMNLPKEFRVDGIRVRVNGITAPDMLSAHMWGVPVRIESVEKIE